MTEVPTEAMMQLAANARLLRRIATLEGGFDALAQDQFDDWADTIWPAPGEIRIIPAVNAQGMTVAACHDGRNGAMGGSGLPGMATSAAGFRDRFALSWNRGPHDPARDEWQRLHSARDNTGGHKK